MKPLEYAENPGTAPSGAIPEVLHAGLEKCIPRHHASIPRDHYLLHLVLSGQGKLRIDRQTFALRSHQCFLIRPYQGHAYQADSKYPWEYLWLGFSGVTNDVLRDVYGIPEDVPAFRPAAPARLELHMRRILEALGSESPLEQLYSRALGVIALGCIGEPATERQETTRQPDYVEEAVSYIESNYAKLRNAQSVAEFVGLDRSYFSKLFQERTGISVARFIAETRMSHAKRLLVDTDYKIKAISSLVGYDNYQSFERRFTAVVGMSPSNFRNRPAGEIIKAGKRGIGKQPRTLSRDSRIPPSDHGDMAEPDGEPLTDSFICADGAENNVRSLLESVTRNGERSSNGSSGTVTETRIEHDRGKRSVNHLLRGAPGCPSHVKRRSDDRNHDST